MTHPLVRMSGISKEFSGTRALDSVDLEIGFGEVISLVGENGSGKSTLIKILSGVYEASAGSLEVDGDLVTRYGPIEAIRAGIHVIYQDFSLFSELSAAENIAFGATVVGGGLRYRAADSFRIARRALDRLGVDLDLAAAAGTLRMVDRQLIAIASALVSEARLIVMDEATTALSRREVDALLEIVRGLRREGIAVVFVSHKLDEVAAISDRNVVIRNGVKVLDQSADELDRAKLVAAMTGQSFEEKTHEVRAVPEDAPVLLELEGLSRSGAFEDVSLRLRAGEILGITGLLGSGRDALALALFGMQPATSGTIRIGGKECRLASVQEALAHGIGFVPEDRLTEGLFLDHSIQDNIVVRTVDRLAGRAGLIGPSAQRDLAEHWVRELEIKTPTVTQAAATLSGGNQQRIVLAKWLSASPQILVLNGPTVGVDVRSKAQIHAILRGLAEQGIGVVVVSDDVPELLGLCHRILLMRAGWVTDVVEPASISEVQMNELLVA